MALVLYALAVAFLLVGAYLTPDAGTKATRVGLALFVAAVGFAR